MEPPSTASSQLDYQGVYQCPICRHGQIATLTLMDAFACNFCHHIFTANLAQQSLHTADSFPSLTWYWNGRSWRAVRQSNSDLTILVWFLGILLGLLPPILIGLTAYIFPPLDPTSHFPQLWTLLTFFCHAVPAMVLLAEYHQFSPYMSLKARLRQFRQRLSW